MGSDIVIVKKDEVYVLELSSYQLDLIQNSSFKYAILLNITKDHIDHHGSYENYIKAKARIFNNNCELAIIGIDSEESHKLYQQISKKRT